MFDEIDIVEEYCLSVIGHSDTLAEYAIQTLEQMIAGRRRERDAERRLMRRLAVMSVELRVCPVCQGKFEVLLHRRPGRVREYCSGRCGGVARVRRHRVTVLPRSYR